jgi:hypothetical protein
MKRLPFATAVGLSLSTAQAQFSIVNSIPGTFTDISATGTVVAFGDDSSQPFTSGITNALVTNPNLYASTNGNITTTIFNTHQNTFLPFSTAPWGLYPLWDDLVVDGPGSLKHQLVNEGGVNVEIIQWTLVRTQAAGANGPRGTFQVKLFASDPVMAQFIYQDVAFGNGGSGATIGFQLGAQPGQWSQYSYNTANSVTAGTVLTIQLTCYPNCDNSTAMPCMNIQDFACFINRFSAGETWANCDNSATPPVLNILDFNCFLGRWANGCSAC